MSFFSLLQQLIVALVWALANVVYLDLKRKGIRGFTRFAAFWTGQPTTWITFFAVREGRQPTFHVPEDDEDEGGLLLADIRRDRALREGALPGGGTPEDSDGAPGEAGNGFDEGRERASEEGPDTGSDDGSWQPLAR
jgi:hypothetical protein